MADREINNVIRWKQDQASAATVIKSNDAVGKSFSDIRKEADGAYEALVKQKAAEQEMAAASAQYAKAQADAAETAQRHGDNLIRLKIAQEQAIAESNAQIASLNRLHEAWESDVASIVAYDQALQATAESTEKLTTANTRAIANRLQIASTQESGGSFVGGLRSDAFGGGAGAGGVNSGEAAIRGVRNAAIALPGIGYQSPVAFALRGAEMAAGAGVSLAALGAVGAALGVFVIALNAAGEAAKKNAERIQAAAQAYRDATEQTLTQTTDELKATRDKLVRQLALDQQNATQAELARLNYARENPQVLTPIAGGLFEALSGTGGTYTGLQSAADDANAALAKTQDALAALNIVLAGEPGTAGDADSAREALGKLGKTLADDFQKVIDGIKARAQALLDIRVNAAVDAQGLTQQQRTEAVNAIYANVTALQEFIQDNNLSAAEVQKLNAQIEELETRAKELSGINETYADVLDRQARAQQALIDKSDAVNSGLQDLAKITQQLGDASKKSSDTLQALTDATAEHRDKQRQIILDFADKEADLRRKLGEKLLDIDAKSTERLLQQKENDNLSIEAAVARGDIAAAQGILAQQRVREVQERRNVETQKNDARVAAEEQLQAARDNAAKLIKNEQDRYDKEYAQRQRAHADALDQERALLAAQEAQRSTNAFSVQYWNGVIAQSYAALGGAAQQAANQINSAANTVRSSGSSYSPAAGAGSNGRGSSDAALAAFYAAYNGGTSVVGHSAAQPFAFDAPSFNRRPGIYRSMVPELHIPIADFNRIGGSGIGGPTLTVNVDARGSTMSEAEYRRITREETVPIVERYQIDTVQRLTQASREARRVR